jgi:hypothetical protein
MYEKLIRLHDQDDTVRMRIFNTVVPYLNLAPKVGPMFTAFYGLEKCIFMV